MHMEEFQWKADCANGARNFRSRKFCCRNFRRWNFSSNGTLAKRNFCRTKFSPREIFAEWIIFRTEYSPNWFFASEFYTKVLFAENFPEVLLVDIKRRWCYQINSVTGQFFHIHYNNMVTKSNKKYKCYPQRTIDNLMKKNKCFY